MTFLDAAAELLEAEAPEALAGLSETTSGRITHVFVSSAISFIDYDIATQELSVTFRNGGPYVFTGVPQSLIEGWVAAPSAGSYYNRFIRGSYS